MQAEDPPFYVIAYDPGGSRTEALVVPGIPDRAWPPGDLNVRVTAPDGRQADGIVDLACAVSVHAACVALLPPANVTSTDGLPEAFANFVMHGQPQASYLVAELLFATDADDAGDRGPWDLARAHAVLIHAPLLVLHGARVLDDLATSRADPADVALLRAFVAWRTSATDDPVAIASGLRAAVRVLAGRRPSHVETVRTLDAMFSVVAEILRRWSCDDALEGDLAAIEAYLRLARIAPEGPLYLDAA